MPIASQVKSLAEDIEASYGARVVAVSDIIKETHQTLGGFHRAHQKMADELRDSLSTSERERMKEFAILIGDVKAAVKAIEKDTAETRAENVKDLKEMAHKLAEFLSSSEKGRLEEFADFMNGVKGAVGVISRDTAQMRANHVKDLKEMAEKLAAFLSSSEKDRKEEFASLIGEIKAAVKAIEKDTAETRAENVKDLKEMASQLKEFLSKSESQRLSEFKAFFSDVQKRTAEILTATQKDLKEARTHWQNLAKVMAAKRAGKPIPKPQAVMGVPAVVKVEAEEAFKAGELTVKVLEVLQAHPGGMTLSQIGKALNVAYIRVAKPLKDLVTEMRVTKRDSEYFPA